MEFHIRMIRVISTHVQETMVNLAKRRRSCLTPALSKRTVALVSMPVPSTLSTTPRPKRSWAMTVPGDTGWGAFCRPAAVKAFLVTAGLACEGVPCRRFSLEGGKLDRGVPNGREVPSVLLLLKGSEGREGGASKPLLKRLED